MDNHCQLIIIHVVNIQAISPSLTYSDIGGGYILTQEKDVQYPKSTLLNKRVTWLGKGRGPTILLYQSKRQLESIIFKGAKDGSRWAK